MSFISSASSAFSVLRKARSSGEQQIEHRREEQRQHRRDAQPRQ